MNAMIMQMQKKTSRFNRQLAGETRPSFKSWNKKMTEEFDYSIFEQVEPTKEEKATLENLVHEAEIMKELKENIDDLTETLGELNKQYIHISQHVIPSMLDELGMKSFDLKDGGRISVKDFMSGSLPKDPQQFEAAVDWLKDNDLESILKTHVNLQFGKGSDNEAKNLLAMLREQGYEPNSQYTAHPQTLYASIRELMKDGKTIPFELLGLYVGKRAEIKLGKK